MKTKIGICKNYFAMHKEMFLETQFNKKVDLNTKIYNYKKQYNIDILDKGIELYNKFKTLSLTNNNDDNISEISDMSEISDID
jgi:hypothetical protein